MSWTCETCGLTALTGHRCPPLWLCLDVDALGDDWEDALVVRARAPDEAARDAASLLDDRGGEGPKERQLMVRQVGTTDVTVYNITYELDVTYSARKYAEIRPLETQAVENKG